MFFSELVTTKIGKTKWKLDKALGFWSARFKIAVIAPKGFITDFASIPKCCWWLFSPGNSFTVKPSVIHDFMYSDKYFPRKLADDVFLEAMKINGVPLWKRQLMYRAVRLFGASRKVV